MTRDYRWLHPIVATPTKPKPKPRPKPAPKPKRARRPKPAPKPKPRPQAEWRHDHTVMEITALRLLDPEVAEWLWVTEPNYRPFLKLVGWAWAGPDTLDFTLQPNKET